MWGCLDASRLGSSPRLRATLRRAVRKFRRLGIIPAYAGNTQPVRPCPQCNRDHPRVCGEHSRRGSAGLSFGGSSPRMRGTPFVVIAVTVWRGIIPAYAGNTLPVLPNPFSPRDHPRVCGEHGEIDVCMAGNMGSSPRMRGTRQERVERRGRLGIIPAYAGNTGRDRIRLHPPRDHPRVCGEHHGAVEPRNCHPGSSPRMRGTLAPSRPRCRRTGIIPAYAGNTFLARLSSCSCRDHPRVCGEHLPIDTGEMLNARDHPRVCGEHVRRGLIEVRCEGSSPRMRGTLIHFRLATHGTGIIPAYAGNTWLMLLIYRTCWDHPRVCGEHWTLNLSVTSWPGSSPRMRGTPDR